METVTLTISVEDDIYDKLCAAAERDGVTLEQYHLQLLDDAYPEIAQSRRAPRRDEPLA